MLQSCDALGSQGHSNVCHKHKQVIFGHKLNRHFKPYVPHGEIICSQQDASAFTGRVGFCKGILTKGFTLSCCVRGARCLPLGCREGKESFLVWFIRSWVIPVPWGFSCSIHRGPSRSLVVPGCSCHQQRGLQDHVTGTGENPVPRDSEARVFR